MLIVPLVPSSYPTLICTPFNSSAFHLAPAASVLQALKFGTLSHGFLNKHLLSYFPPSSKKLIFSSWPFQSF